MNKIGKLFQLSRGGFTIVEFLVAMLISSVVMSAVYASYTSQQKTYSNQTETAAMMQGLRAALFHLDRDIRMAGYDPTRSASAGIVTAGSDTLQFTYDDDGDGAIGAGETILYELYVSSGITSLRRTSGGQPVVERVDALNFVYLDLDRAVTTVPAQVRSVQVALVVRSARADPDFVNDSVFRNIQDAIIYTAPGDHFRRKMLTTEIRCRNLGLP